VALVKPGTLYLDDLHVGQRFAAGPLSVTADDILRFAREFDPQPFHLDPEAAKATMFKGLAASGWHTAALTMRLLNEGGAPLADGIVGVGGEIGWPHPVRPGDTLSVESEILDIVPSRSRPNQAIVTGRSQTINQNGKTVQTLTAKLVVFARATGSGK
jgi:acyl dehydratase